MRNGLTLGLRLFQVGPQRCFLSHLLASPPAGFSLQVPLPFLFGHDRTIQPPLILDNVLSQVGFQGLYLFPLNTFPATTAVVTATRIKTVSMTDSLIRFPPICYPHSFLGNKRPEGPPSSITILPARPSEVRMPVSVTATVP